MTSAKTGKKQDTRFKSGKSGNPKGRPQGSRNTATILAQNLLDGQAEALVQKVIDRALEGDMTALKLCIDRLVPCRKDSSINFEFPRIDKFEDLHKLIAAIINAVAGGQLTPTEGELISKPVERFIKIYETAYLEKRLEELERREGVR
jgi:hypothetical protein